MDSLQSVETVFVSVASIDSGTYFFLYSLIFTANLPLQKFGWRETGAALTVSIKEDLVGSSLSFPLERDFLFCYLVDGTSTSRAFFFNATVVH